MSIKKFTLTTDSIQSVICDDKFLHINWSNGTTSIFPFIFLRDNCPAIRHANGQKLSETAALDINIQPAKTEISGAEILYILWTDGHESRFPITWLWAHDLSDDALIGSKGIGRYNIPVKTWDGKKNNTLPQSDYREVSGNNQALADWLGYIRELGFAILRNVPPRSGAVLDVVNLFGYIRETNYGKLFDVKTVINPNNLAFTGLGISPHTDNPYRSPVPTLQLLHCLSSNADGGDSILVDSFKVAADLRIQHPVYFKLLSSVIVTFKFRDAGNWLEYTTPIIQLYPDGSIEGIRFNNRSIQPFELPPAKMLQYYEAYLCFAKMLDNPSYQVRFKMSAGDLYIVDNERVMHARSAYDNKNGERWLQGAYADRDGLISKWRILQETLQQLAKV